MQTSHLTCWNIFKDSQIIQTPMADSNDSIEVILVLYAYQALIDSLFELLHSELVNHTYDQSINHYSYQYHATLSFSTDTGPHLGIPTMTWHYTYCQHVYLYAQ